MIPYVTSEADRQMQSSESAKAREEAVLPKEQQAKVADVRARHEAARQVRLADKVIETPAETKAREEQEAFEIRDAQGKVTDEERLHYTAREQRVKSVKDAIEAARVARVEQEKTGVKETDGAKLDRLAKEAKDMAEADRLLTIEPFTIDSTNPDMQGIYKKVNEIIEYINKKDGKVVNDSTGLKTPVTKITSSAVSTPKTVTPVKSTGRIIR